MAKAMLETLQSNLPENNTVLAIPVWTKDSVCSKLTLLTLFKVQGPVFPISTLFEMKECLFVFFCGRLLSKEIGYP